MLFVFLLARPTACLMAFMLRTGCKTTPETGATASPPGRRVSSPPMA